LRIKEQETRLTLQEHDDDDDGGGGGVLKSATKEVMTLGMIRKFNKSNVRFIHK